MSSTLPDKRRRLNESLNTLSKPFKSPFKTQFLDSTPLKNNSNAANLQYNPSVVAHTVKPTLPTTPTNTKPSSLTPTRSTKIPKQTSFTNLSKSIDPAEAAAQKALTALELQIRSIRNEIDTLNQAAHLNASTTDAYLDTLAQRWRVAAQSAADEVFDNVKERVDRMGGVKAWRDSERNKYECKSFFDESIENAQDDDADCEFDSEGEALPDEEQERRKAQKRRARKEIESSLDGEESTVDAEEEAEKAGEADDAEDDTFTMDMMLQSLNIELDVIGYDKVAQRWLT